MRSAFALLLSSATVMTLPVDFYDAIEVTSRAMAPRRLQEQNQTDNETNQTNQTNGVGNVSNETTGANVTTGIAGFNSSMFAAAFMVNNETDTGCSGQCCQCVANQTNQMLVNASQLLNASCAESGLNRGTNAVCDFLRTQQNITIGMVLGYGNINELATAYCVGNGSCPAPVISASDACPQRTQLLANASDVTSVAAVFATGSALQRGVGSSYLTCLLNTAFTIMDRRVALNKNYCDMVMQSNGGGNQTQNGGNQTQNGGNQNTTGMSAVKSLRNKLQGVQPASMQQEAQVCEYDRRVCEYEQSNPDIAWGYLYSDIQPLKYARGFCAGLLIEA